MKVGDNFKEEFWVDKETYSGFIKLFRDKNPLHVSRDYAKEKGFADKVMFGNILNGFISYFIGECLPVKDVMLLSQEINYKKPVYLNDKLLLKAKVIDIFESVNMVEFKYDFINQENTKIAKGKITIKLI